MAATAEEVRAKIASSSHVFIYSPDAAKPGTRTILKNRGYTLCALTDDPSAFNGYVGSVEEGGCLIIMSHGDKEGFLKVRGHHGGTGKEVNAENCEAFGKDLHRRGITLYLLSCHTGAGAFFKVLEGTGVRCIAPIGYADVQLIGGKTLQVFSKHRVLEGDEEEKKEAADKRRDGEGMGWSAGNWPCRLPRANTAISLPSKGKAKAAKKSGKKRRHAELEE